MSADLFNSSMRLPPGVRWVDFHPGLAGHDAIELTEQAMAGPAAVLMVGDQVLCLCGIVLISRHVGEAWTVINHDLAKRHPLLLTRSVRNVMDITVQSHFLHRVQMTVHSASNEAVRWAFALGFTVEALMRKYGDDQSDHFLFVRV